MVDSVFRLLFYHQKIERTG